MPYRLFIVLSCALWGAAAFAASPSVESVTPPGGQRGTEFELTFDGARLGDTQELMLYGPGLTASKPDVVEDGRVKVKVKAAADCPLGEHALRLRTASGVSELRTVSVTALPVVAEKEPNNTPDKAVAVALNTAVAGVVPAGDVDCFRVELKKGQPFATEVEAIRLGRALFDPYLTVLGPDGKTLAAVDDTALFRQDPFVTFTAPAEGVYTVVVRETNYRGDEESYYLLHLGSFPRPALVYPAGGQAGTDVEVKFLGDAGGEFVQKVKLPADPKTPFRLFAGRDGLSAPTPNPFRVSECVNVLEAEPNDDPKQAAPAAAVPVAFNGIVGQRGDADCFRFAAKKGDVLDVRAWAFRLGSPLDTVVEVFDAAGEELAANDDADTHDGEVRLTVPADGEYVVRVRDKRGQGGPDFVYRVEVTAAKPGLTVFLPQSVRRSQERQAVVVPRGNRVTTFLGVRRDGLDGEVTLEPIGLPPGVKVTVGKVEAGRYLVPVVFEAAADAPVGGALVDVVGTSGDVVGGFRQSVDLVAGPADALYHKVVVDRLTVAVAEAVPFTLELVQPQAPLTQDGALKLKVVAKRQAGFDGQIVVTVPFVPPGVEAPMKATIAAGRDEAEVELKAKADVEARSWQVLVQGRAETKGGTVWASSGFVTLTLDKPLLTGAIEPAAVEVGKSGTVTVKFAQPTPAAARAKLLGLPPGINAAEVSLAAGAREATFAVTLEKIAGVATHGKLVCELALERGGEAVVQNVGRGGVLRVDPEGGTARGPDGKPLSPLEALRLGNKK